MMFYVAKNVAHAHYIAALSVLFFALALEGWLYTILQDGTKPEDRGKGTFF